MWNANGQPAPPPPVSRPSYKPRPTARPPYHTTKAPFRPPYSRKPTYHPSKPHQNIDFLAPLRTLARAKSQALRALLGNFRVPKFLNLSWLPSHRRPKQKKTSYNHNTKKPTYHQERPIPYINPRIGMHYAFK